MYFAVGIHAHRAKLVNEKDADRPCLRVPVRRRSALSSQFYEQRQQQPEGERARRVSEAMTMSGVRLLPRAKSESGSRKSLIIGQAPI